MLSVYAQRHPPPLMIFHGPDGVGKWSAAESYIQASMCEVGSGCGSCPQCRKILRGDHPDFIRFPEERVLIGEQEDPAPFTIRWLLNTRVLYTPFEGPLRFVLFPRAELIQHEAETALLKTLEEPPDHTRFIFLVRDLTELKQTIVSRGVAIPFQLLPRDAMSELGRDLTAEELDLLGGSLHLAPHLRGPLMTKIKEMVRAAFEHPQALVQLEQWIKAGERKAFGDLQDAGSGFVLGYADVLDLIGLVLIHDSVKRDDGAAIARAVFEFKADLHKDQAGMAPYLLGRLFQRLDRVLFHKKDAAG